MYSTRVRVVCLCFVFQLSPSVFNAFLVNESLSVSFVHTVTDCTAEISCDKLSQLKLPDKSNRCDILVPTVSSLEWLAMIIVYAVSRIYFSVSGSCHVQTPPCKD